MYKSESAVMPKIRELTEAERCQIVFLNSQGMSQVKITEKVGCSRRAVKYTIKGYLPVYLFLIKIYPKVDENDIHLLHNIDFWKDYNI